jgi:hypothetical protein
MVVLSTTAQFLYSTSGKRRTFVVEADPGNGSNNVQISSIDTKAATSFVTLVPGQQQAFNNWKGSLWAVATGGTPSVYVDLENEGDSALVKGP